MSRVAILVLAVLLGAPLISLAPPANACAAIALPSSGVPCGRIYPVITITSDGGQYTNLTPNKTVTLNAKVDWSFRMLGDGYAPVSPTDPIKITFEFPRKPAWADIKVAPETLVVDTIDPTKVQPDPTNAGGPEATYDVTFAVKISLTLTDTAVLRDGLNYAKLLVFAKSSENGLYQSGYGIKEFRVVPSVAIHDSDLTPDRYTAVPVENFTTSPVSVEMAGEKVTLTPPAHASFWQPQAFSAQIDPPPAGKVVAAIHDEAGNLVYATQPLDASSGKIAFTATLAQPGLTTASFTLLPDVGSTTPPVAIPVSFVAGDLRPEGFSFPKDYAVADSAVVPTPTGNSADALTEFERDVPFYVFDTAQGVAGTIQLQTPGQDVGRGVASANVLLLDPMGKVLQSVTADAVNFPTQTLRVGSVATDGWYTLRVKGLGLPLEAAWTLKIEVAYAANPQIRNRVDGAADWTPSTLVTAGHNVTLPVAALKLWSPSDLSPKFDGFTDGQYGITVVGPGNTLAYASGLRAGKASFSAPAPGVYRAFVYAEPAAPGARFSPFVRAFTFGVGANTTTIAQKFQIDDTPEIPQSTGGVFALYAEPAGGTPTAPAIACATPGAQLATREMGTNATRLFAVTGIQLAPTNACELKAGVDFASAQTLAGPLASRTAPAKGVPALGTAATLVAFLGAAAVGVAVALGRRR